jgi:A/G-specific adenine glycosylase
MTPTRFAKKLLAWYAKHGRKHLPWQQNINPYRVWISEIMLQQTQVNTVIPYYQRFMQRFPDIASLAAANDDEVLHHWSGLGYYSRARNLHVAAQTIVAEFGSELPNTIDELQSLPGIGRSTAGAIRATAFELPASILDGNVKRVLARHFAVDGWPGKTVVAKQLWELAEQLTPTKNLRAYTQSIMDLGATLCTRSKPLCNACPLSTSCQALASDTVAQYPGKKPRKVLPVKTTTFYLIENSSGEILLEKRPPVGIWGGLWSLPENASLVAQTKVTNWPILRHTFSHFHLDIRPVHCKISDIYTDDAKQVMETRQQLWYNIDSPDVIGLAAPVSKLLASFKQQKTL